MQKRDALRRDAAAIFHAGLAAVQPDRSVENAVRREGTWLHIGEAFYDLRKGAVYVLAFGKAAAAMARALAAILGQHLTGGIMVTKYGHAGAFDIPKIELHEAGHPVPDENGVQAARKVLQLARAAGPDDLVLVAVSGGGSALLPLPQPGLHLRDKQIATELLLHSGATIQEINTVRKHLSAVKGGRLAAAIHPARSCSLILSDVIGDPVETIASGPTAGDASTYEQAWQICVHYDLLPRMPAAALSVLEAGKQRELPETPAPGDPVLASTTWQLIGNNYLAATAARQHAAALGYNALILTTALQGEAREMAQLFPALAAHVRAHGQPLPSPACLICGGETTVTVRGKGRGGRNQELALAALGGLSRIENVLLLSAGTDGTDGPTDAAGAFVDDLSQARSAALGLDWRTALDANDAYTFFHKMDDLLITGPTGTNVMDLQILLAGIC